MFSPWRHSIGNCTPLEDCKGCWTRLSVASLDSPRYQEGNEGTTDGLWKVCLLMACNCINQTILWSRSSAMLLRRQWSRSGRQSCTTLSTCHGRCMQCSIKSPNMSYIGEAHANDLAGQTSSLKRVKQCSAIAGAAHGEVWSLQLHNSNCPPGRAPSMHAACTLLS